MSMAEATSREDQGPCQGSTDLYDELNCAFKDKNYKMQKLNDKRREMKRGRKLTEDLNFASKKMKGSQKTKSDDKSKGRRRKTADEIHLLETCFIKNENWDDSIVEYIKLNSELTYTQIYKWHWDQKKKVKNNPLGRKVPSIDEFGGYCKFDAPNESNKLTKILDVDWNEKVRLLNLECEHEEKLHKSHSEPIAHSCRPIASLPSKEISVATSANTESNIKSEMEANSFITPLKKLKRERYSSDMTNATNSGKNLLSKASEVSSKKNIYVSPFFDDEMEKDYSYDHCHFGNFDNFAPMDFLSNPQKDQVDNKKDELTVFQRATSLELHHENSFDKFFWE